MTDADQSPPEGERPLTLEGLSEHAKRHEAFLRANHEYENVYGSGLLTNRLPGEHFDHFVSLEKVPQIVVAPAPPAAGGLDGLAVIHDSGDANQPDGWIVTLNGHTIYTAETEDEADGFRRALRAAVEAARPAPDKATLRKAFYACVDAATPGIRFAMTSGEEVTAIEEGIRAGFAILEQPTPRDPAGGET
jgi:hypothetical protein